MQGTAPPETVQVVTLGLHGVFDRVRLEVTLGDGSVVAPAEFERLAGKGASKKWKVTMRVANPDGSPGASLQEWLAGHGLEVPKVARAPAGRGGEEQEPGRKKQSQQAAAKPHGEQRAFASPASSSATLGGDSDPEASEPDSDFDVDESEDEKPKKKKQAAAKGAKAQAKGKAAKPAVPKRAGPSKAAAGAGAAAAGRGGSACMGGMGGGGGAWAQRPPPPPPLAVLPAHASVGADSSDDEEWTRGLEKVATGPSSRAGMALGEPTGPAAGPGASVPGRGPNGSHGGNKRPANEGGTPGEGAEDLKRPFKQNYGNGAGSINYAMHKPVGLQPLAFRPPSMAGGAAAAAAAVPKSTSAPQQQQQQQQSWQQHQHQQQQSWQQHQHQQQQHWQQQQQQAWQHQQHQMLSWQQHQQHQQRGAYGAAPIPQTGYRVPGLLPRAKMQKS